MIMMIINYVAGWIPNMDGLLHIRELSMDMKHNRHGQSNANTFRSLKEISICHG